MKLLKEEIINKIDNLHNESIISTQYKKPIKRYNRVNLKDQLPESINESAYKEYSQNNMKDENIKFKLFDNGKFEYYLNNNKIADGNSQDKENFIKQLINMGFKENKLEEDTTTSIKGEDFKIDNAVGQSYDKVSKYLTDSGFKLTQYGNVRQNDYTKAYSVYKDKYNEVTLYYDMVKQGDRDSYRAGKVFDFDIDPSSSINDIYDDESENLVEKFLEGGVEYTGKKTIKVKTIDGEKHKIISAISKEDNKTYYFVTYGDYDDIDYGPTETETEAREFFSGLTPVNESFEVSGPQPGPEAGLSAIINKLIIDEWEAIDAYNSAIVTARLEKYDDLTTVLQDIVNEENIHVGQLQKLLEQISPNTTLIKQGEQEAAEQTSVDII